MWYLKEDRIFSVPGSLDRYLLHDGAVYLIVREMAEPLVTDAEEVDESCVVFMTATGILTLFTKESNIACEWNKTKLEELEISHYAITKTPRGFKVQRTGLQNLCHI